MKNDENRQSHSRFPSLNKSSHLVQFPVQNSSLMALMLIRIFTERFFPWSRNGIRVKMGVNDTTFISTANFSTFSHSTRTIPHTSASNRALPSLTWRLPQKSSCKQHVGNRERHPHRRSGFSREPAEFAKSFAAWRPLLWVAQTFCGSLSRHRCGFRLVG